MPAGFAERFEHRAYHLSPRSRHFKEVLNRAGNPGRDSRYAFMRHWTAGWLKRERYDLYQRLPRSFGLRGHGCRRGRPQ